MFAVLVENIAFDKLVEVHWAGEDKVWHTLRAEYHSSSEQSWSRLSEQLFASISGASCRG